MYLSLTVPSFPRMSIAPCSTDKKSEIVEINNFSYFTMLKWYLKRKKNTANNMEATQFVHSVTSFKLAATFIFIISFSSSSRKKYTNKLLSLNDIHCGTNLFDFPPKSPANPRWLVKMSFSSPHSSLELANKNKQLRPESSEDGGEREREREVVIKVPAQLQEAKHLSCFRVPVWVRMRRIPHFNDPDECKSAPESGSRPGRDPGNTAALNSCLLPLRCGVMRIVGRFRNHEKCISEAWSNRNETRAVSPPSDWPTGGMTTVWATLSFKTKWSLEFEQNRTIRFLQIRHQDWFLGVNQK